MTDRRSAHYNVYSLGSTEKERWETLHKVFENGPNEMNLLIGSTSGIHGSYVTLDDLENPNSEYRQEMEEEGFFIDDEEAFTVLLIQPRLCSLMYGTIGIHSKEDFNWLRQIIDQSVQEIIRCQKENVLSVKF